MSAAYIVAARRTPIGAFQGALAGATAPQLGAAAVRAALESAGIKGEQVDEVLLGCVLPAGLGQAPARQASLGAGVPASVPATTVNKVCGSGMKTAMIGSDAIRAGSARIVVAGGIESMTNAPYLLPKARGGYRMGHGELLDHMFYDGLQNPVRQSDDGLLRGRHRAQVRLLTRTPGRLCGRVGTAGAGGQRRRCLQRRTGAGDGQDPQGRAGGGKGRDALTSATSSDIPQLKPAFSKDGTVTAASSSSIADGAAALVLMSESALQATGARPLARVVAYAGYAQAPEWFTTAPAGAIQRALQLAGWQTQDVDLFEINEAFAVVTMAAMSDLGLVHEKVNVNGGACALGHPIGASGARIIVTLLHALRHRKLRRGVASLCIGGGEATAIALEIADSR